jgi:SAM-dependent methyltransferase
MSDQIIGLHDWFQTPPGQYVLAWEQAQFDRTVADIFGYHALQLGLLDLDTLATNRMQHRWLAVGSTETSSALAAQGSPVDLSAAGRTTAVAAGEGAAPRARPRAALFTEFGALPFPEASLDLVVLPHTLELNSDPHATLREVERVLVPEGRVVICGLNPASLWGLRQRRAHLYQRLGFGELYLPNAGEFIGYRRLRDWLRLLSFEVESGRFGCYRPAVRTEKWLNRCDWMDRAGERWWPIFGAVYFVVAVKRVRGMRLLGPAWKTSKSLAAAPVSIANQVQKTGTSIE